MADFRETPPSTISLVSSMATRALLAELGGAYEARSGQRVAIESLGGVAAAARVRSGEAFDVVVLASGALDELLAAGRLVRDTKVDIGRSRVAIAVRATAPRPDVGSEAALRRAVLAAETVGYSTGPSGHRLAELFERWGISEELGARIVVAPPGVPVGALVANGKVELGFQQLSELIHLDGIDVLGAMPEPIQMVTTFSAAVGARASQPDAARELIAFMASPAAADAKQRQGMEPA
jgi:molybdate transport system substrate-binding protein